MSFLEAVVLGIVEGITEFLPISSTGHLILASNLLGVGDLDFAKTFQISIQLGAILAVVWLYYKKLLEGINLYKKLALAFLPTVLIGFSLYPIVKNYFLGNIPLVLTSLFVGGLALIAFEKMPREAKDSRGVEEMTYREAVYIGLFQSLAIVPGVSRSAATILGGLYLGLSREAIVEFSFLLAIPTMAAATGYDLLKNATSFSSGEFGILTIGLITSFISAIFAVRFLIHYIQSHNFIAFGIYRVILAVVWVLFLVI